MKDYNAGEVLVAFVTTLNGSTVMEEEIKNYVDKQVLLLPLILLFKGKQALLEPRPELLGYT